MTTDSAKVKSKIILTKYHGDIAECKTEEERAAFLAKEPYEVFEQVGNILLRGGAEEILRQITGLVSGTHRLFSNANAQIGVGDSTVAAVATQTDLQAAAANRFFKGMLATFPTVTLVTIGATTQWAMTFRSEFTGTEAVFAWNEWGVRSTAATTPTNILLNRAVASMGTKPSGVTWILEVQVGLS